MEYDNKVDVWQIGVLVFFMLSGREPFVCTPFDKEKVQKMIIEDEPNYEKLANSVSPAAINFIKSALNKDPV